MKAGCHRTEQRRLEKQRRREMVCREDIQNKLHKPNIDSTDHLLDSIPPLLTSSYLASRGSSSRGSETGVSGNRSGDEINKSRIDGILPPFEEVKKLNKSAVGIHGVLISSNRSSEAGKVRHSTGNHCSEEGRRGEHRKRASVGTASCDKRDRVRTTSKPDDASSRYPPKHQEKHCRNSPSDRRRDSPPGASSRTARLRCPSKDRVSRKRPHHGYGSATDTDSDCSPAPDSNQLALIFNLMKCSGGLSPLQAKQRLPSVRAEEESEEELGISEMEERLKSGGWLSVAEGEEPSSLLSVASKSHVTSSPGQHVTTSHVTSSPGQHVTPSPASSSAELAPGPGHISSTGLSEEESEIDSEEEPEFKLSKSVSKPPEEVPRPTPPPASKSIHHHRHKAAAEPLKVVEAKPRKVERRQEPEVVEAKSRKVERRQEAEVAEAKLRKLERRLEPEVAEAKLRKLERRLEPDVKCEVKCEVKEEEDRREVKPVVAVNPRIKNSKEPIRDLVDSYRSGSEERALVDIRSIIAGGAPFNLVLSFGLEKLSQRSVQHELLSKAVIRHTKPTSAAAEKPSCKVPCIPRDLSRDLGSHEAAPRGGSPSTGGSATTSDTDREQHRPAEQYGPAYQRKRRRVAAHEPADFEQFPYPFHSGNLPGIHTTLAIPSLAYLVQQPPSRTGEHYLSPKPDLTFTSRSEKQERRGKVEKALKALLSFESYTNKGKVLKKDADQLTDPGKKIQKYLEACIQYVYSALSLCQKNDFGKGFQILSTTAKIIDHCLQPRARRGLDVRLQDKKQAVLCLILSSHMYRHMWTICNNELHALHISCATYLRGRREEKHKDTSTPSPAGSHISMGSYGSSCDTSLPGDSCGSDAVSSRFLKEAERYMSLSHVLRDSTEQWEEAGIIAEECTEFFAHLDSQCGPIKQNTHLYTVASYIGQGISNLDMDCS